MFTFAASRASSRAARPVHARRDSRRLDNMARGGESVRPSEIGNRTFA